jgi:hypothetical protein
MKKDRQDDKLVRHTTRRGGLRCANAEGNAVDAAKKKMKVGGEHSCRTNVIIFRMLQAERSVHDTLGNLMEHVKSHAEYKGGDWSTVCFRQ